MLLVRDRSERARLGELLEDQQRKIKEWHNSPDGIVPGRGAALARLLSDAHSYQSYRDAWEGIDIVAAVEIAESDPWAALRALPLLDKSFSRSIGHEVLNHPNALLSNYFETSGTTSTPAPAPKSRADLVINTVNFGEHWAGLLDGARSALVLINTPQGPAAFQFEIALNYLGIGTFRTWVDALRNDYSRVLDIVSRTSPDVFAGPPSQLLNLYERAYATGAPVPTFDTVLLTGERSGAALRQRLVRLTGAKVVDASYGSSETGTTAVAVTVDEMRLQTQSYLFELVIGQNEPAKSGGAEKVVPLEHAVQAGNAEGELVVTTLDNRYRPLVRYRTGDLVAAGRSELHGLCVRPLGRVGDTVSVGGQAIDQQLIETVLWGDSELEVLNYLLAHDGDRVDLLYTSSSADPTEDARVTSAIRTVVPTAVAIRVPQLPASTGLGSAAGWKASRVIDIGPDRETEGDLPHLRDTLRHTREFALAARNGLAVAL